MKIMHAICHVEFAEQVVQLLERNGVRDFVQVSMIHGKDLEGKHEGSQVFPGNQTLIEAQVADEQVDPLFDDLFDFKSSREAHHHLQVFVIPIERRLPDVRDQES